MRYDFGHIYKKIRESKGLTQAQVCGNVLSRTTLAKIEANKSVPNFENMLFLLDQINMSLEEFDYICNLYQPNQRQDIFNRMSALSSIGSNDQLYDLKKRCEDYLKTHHDLPVQDILTKVMITLAVRKEGFLNPSEHLQELTTAVWNDLAKQDTWYERDLSMLCLVLYSFPLETILETADKLLESLEKYRDYRNINQAKYAILANLSTIFLYNHRKADCERLTVMLYDLARETKRYDQLGFAQIRLGICRDDQDLINKGLALLELTGEEQLLSNLREELEKLKN